MKYSNLLKALFCILDSFSICIKGEVVQSRGVPRLICSFLFFFFLIQSTQFYDLPFPILSVSDDPAIRTLLYLCSNLMQHAFRCDKSSTKREKKALWNNHRPRNVICSAIMIDFLQEGRVTKAYFPTDSNIPCAGIMYILCRGFVTKPFSICELLKLIWINVGNSLIKTGTPCEWEKVIIIGSYEISSERTKEHIACIKADSLAKQMFY